MEFLVWHKVLVYLSMALTEPTTLSRVARMLCTTKSRIGSVSYCGCMPMPTMPPIFGLSTKKDLARSATSSSLSSTTGPSLWLEEGAAQLAERLNLPPDVVLPVVHTLREAHLVLIVETADAAMELVPGRPLDQITLADLHGLPESRGVRAGDLPSSPQLAAVEARLNAGRAAENAALQVTVAELLEDPTPT